MTIDPSESAPGARAPLWSAASPGPAGAQPRRRRVLALPGGGLRGVFAAAVLERLEALGRAEFGPDYRLAQSFDFICGASTGAVLATATALEVEASRMPAFYLEQAPKVFRRKAFSIPGYTEFFSSRRLHAAFEAETAGLRLRREDLKADLGVMVKNLATGAPMLLTTLAPAGTPPQRILGAEAMGAELPLADLLRASTAAPLLFAPMALPIGPGGEPCPCIDGGASPYNDPSLLAWRAVSGPELGLGWSGGVDVLTVGVGVARPLRGRRRGAAAGMLAFETVRSMVRDGDAQVEAIMRSAAAAAGDALRYVKLDLDLDAEAVGALGVSARPEELRAMRRIADPKGTPLLYAAAQAYAERAVVTPLEPLPTSGRGQVQVA